MEELPSEMKLQRPHKHTIHVGGLKHRGGEHGIGTSSSSKIGLISMELDQIS